LSKSDSAAGTLRPGRGVSEGGEQMDRQQIAHELETILQANLHKHKTALQRRFMPNLPIRHPQ
jgi:hypothetical protein